MAYSMDKQDRIMGQFSKTAKLPTGPTFIQADMARTAEIEKSIAAKNPSASKNVTKAPATRFSFYNPSNPLNGIKTKNAVEQKELKAAIKKAAKA